MSSEVSIPEEVTVASDVDHDLGLDLSRDTTDMPPPPPRVPVALQETHDMQQSTALQKTGDLQQSPQESDTDKLQGSGNGQVVEELRAKLAQATL